MRTMSYAKRLKQDFKREKKSQHKKYLDKSLMTIVTQLAGDKVLNRKYYDHALTGEWQDCSDCHIKPDLVLIYRKPPERKVLELIRLGSHSELGL